MVEYDENKNMWIKRVEDIEYVNKLMPDYVGFVFAKSRRQVDLQKLLGS